MSKKNKPFNIRHLILTNFERAKEIESETNERIKIAERLSSENRKEIRNRQEEFKRKWQ